jgi:hypothetical protein
MKFRVYHSWGRPGKKEKTLKEMDKGCFRVMYGPLLREFADLAKPGSYMRVRIGTFYWHVRALP